MATSSDDPVVVLTGADRGIGYHAVTTLVADGYRVAGIDVDGSNLRSLRDGSPEQFRYYECDVTDTDTVRETVTDVIDRWGRIDVLVNNAAVATFAAFDDRTIEDTRREFEVNLFGYLRTIRAVLPHMRSRDEGVIHNVGSPTGGLGHPGLTGYAATKGAIEGLTRSLRLELRRTGVSCTLVLPPTTDTRMAADLGYPEWLRADPETVGRKLAAQIESTDPVITPDRLTSLGLSLFERCPGLWRATTERYVELPGE